MKALTLRLPGLLLGAGMMALFVAIPYASFTSDVANYALMGWDIINRGYLPTLAYGQSYLFSLTPYSFALTRLILPEWISDIVALKIAGALFSIPGMLLVFESLLMAQRQTGKPQLAPLALFAIIMASSDAYLFDLSLNSSNEMSILLTGALMYVAGRIDLEMDTGAKPSWRLWAMLGVVVIMMQYIRPMLLTFALPAIFFLLLKIRGSDGIKAAAKPLAPFAVGIAIGYLPMLAHILFRAENWPYTWFLPLEIGGGFGIENAVGVLSYVILPRLMTMLWDEAPIRFVITALWLAAVMAIVILAVARRGERGAFTVTDKTWVIGQASSILIMAMIPALSGDTGARRYCLHLLPAVAWIFVRFAFPLGKASMVAVALALAMVVSSTAGWRDKIAWEWSRNVQLAQTKESAIPELAALDAVILTEYWDAYLLSFISREKFTVEAFPWQIIRRYGYFTREDMRRRTVWLVCDGYAHDTQNWLIAEVGAEAVNGMKRRDLENTIVGRRCEAWELQDPYLPEKVMEKHQPRFFSTAYPPGQAFQD
ncbi:MAG: hypothetical protein OEZ04_08395 [Nitrospinota bacterium]|nr:hypothetical protein [Nitrospinota bacterium]